MQGSLDLRIARGEKLDALASAWLPGALQSLTAGVKGVRQRADRGRQAGN